MLILRRKKDESILIGDNIRITIVECGSEGVRIAIDAPKQISILREELSKAEVVNKDALMPQSEFLHAMQAALLKRHPQHQENTADKEPGMEITTNQKDNIAAAAENES